ncbi:MAG TPA: DUF4160 domain-containing protein [Acetobacteraceae bacterium]|nr:DUF4160 domain-containing protein [Acetobacteraceae bacterium]
MRVTLAGLRIVVYPNDHPPAHVYVLGPRWVLVVELLDLQVREAIRCSEHEARKVLRLVESYRDELIDAWRRFHG